MRLVAAVLGALLAACSAGESLSPTISDASSAATAGAEATVVVVGCASVSSREPRRGSIEVDRVLRGAAGFRLDIVVDFDLVEGERQLFFLRGSTEPLRVVRVAPMSLMESLVEAQHPEPGPLPQEVLDLLAVMRDHDQSERGPSAGPAMDAAFEAFERGVWVGRSRAELLELLGPPHSERTHGDRLLWEYVYHNGEQGAVRWLELVEGRVVMMWLVRTE